ncbi:ankyrin [Aspergillus novofumigatus IBT 16806]|uniref:Ankyrin n=1 Tax=Aspergillus novofumigatus (strain IBT 16806) TaxID=1392255 RepID=A0A2I1CED1_ASPN1|nr:ankyrin [Aspergillus novofumigatus IBT 16806]PKX95976.1 ankyrin [Aspergillus novofumigatus IBT 16806]
MDPLSLSVSLAGILPLIATVITTSKRYIDTVRSARKSIATLVVELEALQSNVTNLQDLLKGDELKGSAVRFHKTSVLLACSAACEAKLRSLCKTLGQESNGKGIRLLWPFTEKEHQKTIQEVRNFTNWMQFALSVNGCRLLSRTSDDVLKLIRQQLEQFRAIQTLEADTLRILDFVQDQKRAIQVNTERESRRSILDWVSTLKHDQKHQLIQASRAPNTGTWILHENEFIRWRGDSSPSNVLVCHGIPGSGKTNLASIIIDELLNSSSTEASPVAFFYFDHQDHSTQGTSEVLCCMLRQLLEKLPAIPSPVAELFQKSGHKGQMPLHECERLLTDIASGLRCTYLVLDGLDESEDRKSLLQSIKNIIQSHQVRLLVTSRPHIPDLVDLFQQHPNIRIEAHEEDLKTYLYRELDQGGIYDIADQDFANRLVQNLTQGAEGMFLLPVLRLRTILKEPTLGEMEDRITDLSHSLSGAFADTISRIQRLPESRSRLGMGALMWLTYTPRALRAAELSDALATQRAQNVVNSKYRPTTKTILECCQGLAIVDAEGYIRLAHYTIQEYVGEHWKDFFPQAEAQIAVTCLRYLVFENFQNGPWLTEGDIKSNMETYPFLAWAAMYWGQFAQRTETDAEVWRTLFAFFSSPAAMATANQIRQYLMGRNSNYWNADECSSFSALHHASRHGLERAIIQLLDSGAYDVNELTSMGSTPVIHAAAGGHVLTTRSLLARGADPYLRNWYGDALHCAVESDKAATVRELVCWGMDPNGRSYLACALDGDSASAFAALVELGADIASQSAFKSHGHLFFTAALWGCDEIIALMLKQGWVNIGLRNGKGLTALHCAAAAANLTSVRILLDAGADIGAMDDGGRTPLEFAEGNETITRLLLDSGATSSHLSRSRQPSASSDIGDIGL